MKDVRRKQRQHIRRQRAIDDRETVQKAMKAGEGSSLTGRLGRLAAYIVSSLSPSPYRFKSTYTRPPCGDIEPGFKPCDHNPHNRSEIRKSLNRHKRPVVRYHRGSCKSLTTGNHIKLAQAA